MPALSKLPVIRLLRAIGASAAVLVLAACQQPNSKTLELADYSELSDQLGAIIVETVPFDELPGETRAEKLLYQAGIVAQMKTASLVMIDTQIKTLELAGNEEVVAIMKKNREMMMVAMEAEASQFVTEAAAVYEQYVTPEEIERLIVLHGDPAMQKLLSQQPQISRDLLPAATAFGERAALRMQNTATD